jgi:hypothetical protein
MRTNFPHSEQLNRLALRPNEEMYAGRCSPFERVMVPSINSFILEQHIPNAKSCHLKEPNNERKMDELRRRRKGEPQIPSMRANPPKP